mgnify:CR=1 FL=1
MTAPGNVIHRLKVEGADLLALSGVNDANLQELARLAGVRVSLRGDQLSLSGELEAVERETPTIFVFTADHGNMLVDHALFVKWSAYEASVRVPLLAWHPARFSGGRMSRDCSTSRSGYWRTSPNPIMALLRRFVGVRGGARRAFTAFLTFTRLL